jgi:predicted GIY-YIG superfamily endonuclease
MSRHVLYRMYAADDDLLYVGLTKDPASRFKQHSDSKDWFPTVAKITVQHFATREELVVAEVEAIRKEGPRYNIVHNVPRDDDSELGPFHNNIEEEDYEDFLMYAAMAKSDVDLRLDPDCDSRELFSLYMVEAREACPPEAWIARHSRFRNADSAPLDGKWELVEYEPEVPA